MGMTRMTTSTIVLACLLVVLSAASPSLREDGEHIDGARLQPTLFQRIKTKPLGKRRSLSEVTAVSDTAALEQLTQDYVIVEGQGEVDEAPVLDAEADRKAGTDTEEHAAAVIDAEDQAAHVADKAAEAAPVLVSGAAATLVEQHQHAEKQQQPKEAASNGLPSFGTTPIPPRQTLEQWRQRTVAAVNSKEEMSSGAFLLPGHPKKGYAAACLIVRDTHDDVGEWVRHNLRLGFWPIYIFDDGSAPPMADALRRYTDSGDVVYTFLTTFSHSSNKPQLYVYDRCLQDHGSKHSWMAFFDVDEFLVFRDGPPVQSAPALLRSYENSSALAVHWLFGSSGHEVRPSKGVLRSYTRCVPLLHAQHLFVKSIVNTRCTTGTTETPHTFVHNCSAPAVRTDFSPVYAATAEDFPVHATLALHHYATKSVEEFEIKMLRGSGMRRQRGWEYFAFVDDWSVDFNFDGLRAWDDDVGMPSRIDSGEALEEQLTRYAGEEHEEYWKTARRGQAQLWLHGQAQAELFAGQGSGQGDDEATAAEAQHAGADTAGQGRSWTRALHERAGEQVDGESVEGVEAQLVEDDKGSGLKEGRLPS